MEGRPAPRPAVAPSTATPSTAPIGGFVDLNGEAYYRIAAYHRLDPFLMSVPSDTDLWMFVASSGGLTAGRVDTDGSLFPYETVDRLYDAHRHAGPTTLVRVDRDREGRLLWEPFAEDEDENPHVERNLYKNVEGNRVIFEEIRHDLGLAFRQRWAACDEFGWIRTATLYNLGEAPVWADVLDGLCNVLPYGAPLALYQQASTLVDAYRTSEVDPDTGLGVFALTAGITDRAEALETLRANAVWCSASADFKVHLSPAAVDAFRRGRVTAEDRALHGTRGNYLVGGRIALDPGELETWHFAADSGLDHLRIAELRRMLREETDLGARIEAALDRARENLRRNVASADGLELSGRPESWSHHFANVLFNNMRGGVFVENHQTPSRDFALFLQARNTEVASRHRDLLDGLPENVAAAELHRLGRESGDPDLARLCLEYLPLHFGRRHGDPSRPWNRFSIRTRNGDGERELNYEGNWRDIFQNWEAMSASFPEFLPSIVAAFVSASTVDGFNPYRITREGVDWETVEPDDPWSNIGYWGDHQIVYLLRLLELLERHDPGALDTLLGEEIFTYAEVPYRLKPYAEILRDPSSTIDFDDDRHERILERSVRLGGDGRLLHAVDGTIRRANLLEKLLVPVLSKLSNLVPDAGIWMNTQRPEWNDANNVLAGGGVSAVTLCHLRRYLHLLGRLVDDVDAAELPVAAEIVAWFDGVAEVLEKESTLLSTDHLDSATRKRLMDALGGAFSSYRERVYDHGLSDAVPLSLDRVAAFCGTALAYVDWGIAANRRDDGLYHSYNLLEITDDGVEVVRLQEMLEGQVAVLSSGLPDAEETLSILERLFASDMYRTDQRSFMLYPERAPKGFLERNVVPDDLAEAVPLVRGLLQAGDASLIARDADGRLRFHGDLRNAAGVAAALDRLADRAVWRDAVPRDRDAVLDLYEQVFAHRSYTGRSGVMYAYEGQGCVYWHMVAKLLLAVQEIHQEAVRTDVAAETRDGLAAMYFRIRAGIGYEKTVAEYGAFPTDPYSHTPPGGGAKQPGLTGQVKEEILTRRGELGVRVERGTIRFEPRLLRRSEFRADPSGFRCYNVEGEIRSLPVPANGLAFTVCQTPVIYELVDGTPSVNVTMADGAVVERPCCALDAPLSAALFAREGRIDHIHVGIPRSALGAR